LKVVYKKVALVGMAMLSDDSEILDCKDST